jgi:superfamily II DNA/RNA helicase
MLDMGFHDDIIRIISYLPANRQNLLFSATMPPKIRNLASKLLKNPLQINIAISKPAEGIVQQCYLVHDSNKLDLISGIIKNGIYNSIIIFASTKEKVKKLDATLRKANFQCKAFHSDLDQKEREEIMREFKNRQLNMLIGTDVLSRGIDVEGIDLVVNYDVPPDPEDYVHRIGRTARAERDGTALTLINPRDQRKFADIERLLEKEVTKLPVPPDLGPAPEWKPFERRFEGGGGRFGGGGGGFKGGGGKPRKGGKPGGGPGKPRDGQGRPRPEGEKHVGPKPVRQHHNKAPKNTP